MCFKTRSSCAQQNDELCYGKHCSFKEKPENVLALINIIELC